MKQIPLTHGKIAFVDDEDFDWLNQWHWHAWKHPQKKTWYAVRNLRANESKNRTIVKMHRKILNLTDPKIQVDHFDKNGLNNQKVNLRVCNTIQNCANTDARGGVSKYKGVHLKTYPNKSTTWIAQINVGDKRTHLGCFKKEKDAAIAYNSAALKEHGEFARLNKI